MTIQNSPVPACPYVSPFAHSEDDVQRLLADIAAMDHAEMIWREALQVATRRMHDDLKTIKALQEQLAALREELRAARA